MKDYAKYLKAGDTLSCTSNKLVATLIKKATRSRINHSAHVIEIWGELFVVDAQKHGVNPCKLEDWIKKYNYDVIVHRRLHISKEELEALYKRAMSKVGHTPYDFKSLCICQPYYLATGKWIGKTEEDAESRMYCSEFEGWLVRLANYWTLSPYAVYLQLKHDKRYATASPENIANKTKNLIKIADIYKDKKESSSQYTEYSEDEEIKQIQKEIDDINELKS